MLIRPIRATDRPKYRSILDRTSPEDRYFRFFRVVDHIDEAEIHRFCDPSADMFGLIALDRSGRPMGTIHAVFPDRATAEMAIVVARDARHRGVATRLLDALIAELRGLGFRELVAHALPTNHGFAALARAAGMHVAASSETAITWRVDLAAPVDAPAEVTARPSPVPAPAPRLRLR